MGIVDLREDVTTQKERGQAGKEGIKYFITQVLNEMQKG
jgi:hypothetical protein